MLQLSARALTLEPEHVHGLVIGYQETEGHRTPEGKSVLLPKPAAIRAKLDTLFSARSPGALPEHAICPGQRGSAPARVRVRAGVAGRADASGGNERSRAAGTDRGQNTMKDRSSAPRIPATSATLAHVSGRAKTATVRRVTSLVAAELVASMCAATRVPARALVNVVFARVGRHRALSPACAARSGWGGDITRRGCRRTTLVVVVMKGYWCRVCIAQLGRLCQRKPDSLRCAPASLDSMPMRLPRTSVSCKSMRSSARC